MGECFLYLWTRGEFEEHRANGDATLWSASGKVFRKRGLTPDGYVYVVSCFNDTVYLLGRIDVSQVLGSAEAHAFTGDDDFDWYQASDHIFCEDEDARPMLFDLVVPDEVIRRMRFANGAAPVCRKERGRLIPDPQTFRSFRRLSSQTAQDFDRLLAARFGNELLRA